MPHSTFSIPQGLPFMYLVAFLDYLWKQKSEKEGEKEEEEDDVTSLDSCSLLKEAPVGQQATTTPSQLSCVSEGLHKAIATPEQGLTQTPSPSKSFPTFQILTNLPVRHKTSGSHLQQRKSQFFWGLPSLHSESLEAIFPSSGGPSPLKLSVGPSIFFNKLVFLTRSNLLLPQYCSPTQHPTHEVHTTKDLEGMACGFQQLPPLSSLPVPSLSLFPMDHKGVPSDAEVHTQCLPQQREVPGVSEDQALHPLPEFQRTRPFKLFSSEVWLGMRWDPSIQRHSLDLLPASLLYPSTVLGVLTRFEAPWETNEYPKTFEPAISAPSPTSASLPELQGVSPIGGLSGLKVFWKTTRQRESPQTSETPILIPCQSVTPKTKPQGTGSPLRAPSLALSPPLALVLELLRVSPTEILIDSEARSGDIQRRKNSWASELPTGVSPLRVLSDSEPLGVDMEQKEICCVPASPMWGPSPSPNSMSKLLVSGLIRDQCSSKPEGEAIEQRENCWATELLALTPSSFSAPLPDPHIDLEVMCRNVQQRGYPQGPSPPAADPLQPILWLPTLAEALKIKPNQPGLLKGELFPGAKAEISSFQGEAVLEMPIHSGSQAWHWSRELELKLKKLQQNPTSRSFGPSQPFGSSPTLSSTTLGTWRLSSCPPPKHLHSLHPDSSSCHHLKVQSTVTQPVQASHCYHSHSSSQPQPGGSGRAEQRSEREKRMEMMAQVSSQGQCIHNGTGENCPGQGQPSNPEVPASGKTQDKTLALSSIKKRDSPWKPKVEDHGGGDIRLESSTVTRKSHPAQARLADASVSRLSQKSQHSHQSSRHSALPQQRHSKAAGPQDRQGAGLGAGDTLTPRHCKHYSWAHMEKHLSSPTPQASLIKGLQKIFAKCLGIHGPLSPKSREEKLVVLAPSNWRSEAKPFGRCGDKQRKS